MTEQSKNLEESMLQTVSKQKTEDYVTTSQKKIASSNKYGYMEGGTGEHQSNQVWGKDNTCPTIPCVSWKEPLKIVEKRRSK